MQNVAQMSVPQLADVFSMTPDELVNVVIVHRATHSSKQSAASSPAPAAPASVPIPSNGRAASSKPKPPTNKPRSVSAPASGSLTDEALLEYIASTGANGCQMADMIAKFPDHTPATIRPRLDRLFKEGKTQKMGKARSTRHYPAGVTPIFN